MRIHHISITVKDAEKSAAFYKDNFGFTEAKRFTKPDWDGGAIVLQLEGMELELFHFKSSKDNKDNLSDLKVIGPRLIGIEVENVRDMHRKLKDKGVDIDEPMKGTTCAWLCFLRDPDEIPLELYQPNQKVY